MKEKILENQKNNHTMNYMDNSKGMDMNMGMGMMGIGMNLGNMLNHTYDVFEGGYASPPNWNITRMNQQINMGMMNQ